jgi:hypothetical protein
VVSHYEAYWQPILQRGLEVSGYSSNTLQRQGAATYLWLMTAAGTKGGALSHTGSIAYTSTYSLDEYRDLSKIAAQHDYTLEELQKSGTLLLSWFLAGRPPLPN